MRPTFISVPSLYAAGPVKGAIALAGVKRWPAGGIGDFLGYRPNTVGVDINERIVGWCREHGLSARLTPSDERPFETESYDGASQSP